MAWQATEHRDFSGGENLVDSPRNLAENQVVLLENFLIAGRGQAQTRKGMTIAPGTAQFPARIDLYKRFLKRDGTVLYMVISENALWLHDGTKLIDGLSDGPYGTVVYQDKFLLVDGTEYYESDGTPSGTKPVELPDDEGATLDEIRRCTILLEHNGRIYATGDKEAPGTIYYSQVNRYDYFLGEDSSGLPQFAFQAAVDDAERPVILTSLYGGLLLGKRSGWWLITGDPDLGIQSDRIIVDRGPVNRQFVTVRGTELWYLSEDGVRVVRQPSENTFDSSLASYEHRPLFSAGDMSNLVMQYHDERILFFYKLSPDSDDNDFCSVIDLRFRDTFGQRHGSWSRITGWPVTAVLRHSDNKLWAGLADGRIVRLSDGDTDLGEPIKARLWTAEYTLGDPYTFKLFDSINIHAAQENQESELIVHESIIGSTQKRQNVPLTGFRGSVQRNVRFRPTIRGTYIQHRIENTSGPLTILGVGERWRPLRAMRPHEVEGTL